MASYYNYGFIYDYSYYYNTYNDYYYGNYNYSKHNGAKFSVSNLQVNANAVPEPGTIGLMGLGLLGLVAARRRKQRIDSISLPS